MFNHYSICLCSIVLAVAYYLLYQQKTDISRPDPITVAIGILSARENFLQREAIRSTWLNADSLLRQGVNLNAFKSWFIVGNQSCSVPPQCRRNKYDCEKWHIHFSDVHETFFSSEEVFIQGCSNNEIVFHQGFSFQVNHPVVVTKLGIYSKLLPHGEKVTVSLLDLQTKDVVVNATFTTKQFNINYDKFIYNDVDNFLLPKNYEGLLLVEGPLLHSSCSSVNWSNNSGIITFTRVFQSADDTKSVVFSDKLQAAPSIGFMVHDMKGLRERNLLCGTVSSDWENYCQKINDKLFLESKVWGDILFVDVCDTYRNLPKKLLLFYNWLISSHSFDYVLKTDDDCVIDVSEVLKQLHNSDLYNPKQLWLWSRFRSRWPVNYVGKWADYAYKSPVYPSFPCGAAYVMSHKVVHWLKSNAHYLYSYQGEDVSLGIWLTAINPLYIEDIRWECDDTCTVNSYNRAQLNPQEIFDIWSLKEKCGNLCGCEILNV